jgi:3-oxoacyl-[acyl-carrier-protein] synthase I
MPSITGIGITSALGAGAAQCCAALRAGLSKVAESKRYAIRGTDPNGDLEPVRAAEVLSVPAAAKLAERLYPLALPALGEAIASAGLSRTALGSATLHVALPGASRPGYGSLADDFAVELCRRGGIAPFVAGTVSRAGHSGVVEAMSAALASLQKRPESAAIVLGVDSLLDKETFKWLDQRDRLKGSRNPEGLAAGEAAVALVIERTRHAEARSARLRATVDALGTAHEDATIFKPERPNTGNGLTRALRAAVESLGESVSPPWVLTDHNGERHRAQEFGYVVNRVTEVFSELRHTWYAADGVGDTGAAAGGLLIARAAHAFERGYAPGPRALIFTGSDDGGRGVLVIGDPAPGRN